MSSDHGAFTLDLPDEAEAALLEELVRAAVGNPVRPGEARVRWGAGPRHLEYALDLARGELVITEVCDGIETASATFPAGVLPDGVDADIEH